MTRKELLEAFDKFHNACAVWSRRWEPDLACNCGLLQALDEMNLDQQAALDAVQEEAYDAGYSDGQAYVEEELEDVRGAAYEQGYNEAHSEGFNKGYTKGYSTARDQFETFDDAS